MSLVLNLDSSMITGSNSNDFTVSFENNPIILSSPGGQKSIYDSDKSADHKDEEWEMALVRGALWYSWANISAAKNNHQFYYSIDSGATWETPITFADGIYSVNDLDSLIKAEMFTRNHWDAGGEKYYISLDPNFNTLRVTVSITSATYRVDFTQNRFHLLLGHNSVILIGQSETIAPNNADVNDGVNSLVINCSLTDSGYTNNNPGSGIFQFTPTVSPGSNIDVFPNNPIYVKMNTKVVRKVRMFVTDQSNNSIDFRGENVSYLLHIRKRGQ